MRGCVDTHSQMFRRTLITDQLGVSHAKTSVKKTGSFLKNVAHLEMQADVNSYGAERRRAWGSLSSATMHFLPHEIAVLYL